MMDWINKQTTGRLRALIVLAIFAFVATLMTHEKHMGEGDEPHYMLIAQSLVFDGDLDLANNYADKTNIISDGNLAEKHIIPGKEGHTYSSHDVGLPLLFAPWFAASSIVSESLVRWDTAGLLAKVRTNRWNLLKTLLGYGMILVTGFLGIQIFDISLRLTGNKAVSFLGTILFLISPPMLSFSHLFFAEMLSAAIAFYIYNKMEADPDYSAVTGGFLGFWCGFLFLIHTRNILLAVTLVAFVVWKWQENEAGALGFIAAFIAVLIFRRALTWHMWGSGLMPDAVQPHAFPELLYAAKQIVLRIFALSYDQEGGFLIYAPAYLFGFAGLLPLWRKSRDSFYKLTAIFFGNYFLIVSFPLWNPHGWSGFWSPASRYLMPAMPALAIAGIVLLARIKIGALAKALIAFQCALNLFFWQFPKLLWNEGSGTGRLFTFLDPSGTLSRWVPSWPWDGFNLRSLWLSIFLLFLSCLAAHRLLKCGNGFSPKGGVS